MADAADSKSAELILMSVRVRLSALQAVSRRIKAKQYLADCLAFFYCIGGTTMRGIKVKTVTMTLETALEKFINHCRIKNLTPATIRNYEKECGYFISWFGQEKELATIDADTIDEFILYCRDSDNSEAYIASRVRQNRAFLYWCMEREYLREFAIKIPKATETVKEPYTDAELTKLIRQPSPDATFAEWRNWCLVNFLIGTGCRISTALNIRISDVDFQNSRITLTKLKNRSIQLIPVSSALIKVLKKYLKLWEYSDTDYLFPTYEGTKFQTSSAQSAITLYNKSRGVSRYSAHLFRHTYAKNYIMAGGNAFQLQRLMGHSTLDMTNHYVRLYADDLAIGYDGLNPLDNLKK